MIKYIALLLLGLMTCGFTWGKSGAEKCDDARQLATELTGIGERKARLEAEARIQQLCPDGAVGQYLRGLNLEQAGNPERAAVAYQEALRLDPDFAAASGALGLIALQQGQLDDAAVALTKAMQGHTDPRYHKGLARIFSEKQLYSLALYHYREALRSFPNDPALLAGQAEVLLATGQTEKAQEGYRRALAIEPGHTQSLVGLAALYTAGKQYDQAIAWLETGMDQREGSAVLIGVHPAYDDLRRHPAFSGLLRRLGLAD